MRLEKETLGFGHVSENFVKWSWKLGDGLGIRVGRRVDDAVLPGRLSPESMIRSSWDFMWALEQAFPYFDLRVNRSIRVSGARQ